MDWALYNLSFIAIPMPSFGKYSAMMAAYPFVSMVRNVENRFWAAV